MIWIFLERITHCIGINIDERKENGTNNDGCSGDHDLNLIVNKLREDNVGWQKELEKLSLESEEIKFIKLLNKKYNDELNARIADLLKINQFIENKKSEFHNIIQSIHDRHDQQSVFSLTKSISFDDRSGNKRKKIKYEVIMVDMILRERKK